MPDPESVTLSIERKVKVPRVRVCPSVTADAQYHHTVLLDQQPKRFFRMIVKVGSHQVAIGHG